MADREEKLEPCELCGGTGIAVYCKCDTEPTTIDLEREGKLKARIAELEEILELATYAWFKGNGGAGSWEDMGSAMDAARAALKGKSERA